MIERLLMLMEVVIVNIVYSGIYTVNSKIYYFYSTLPD